MPTKLLLRLLLALTPVFACAQEPKLVIVPLDGATRWDYLTVDSAAHRVYVAHGGQVDAYDTQTYHPAGLLEPAAGVHGITLAGPEGRVFTSNGASGEVGVFELKTGALQATIKAGRNPDAIVYEPHTHRVFAFNGRSKDMTVIDATSVAPLVEPIALGGKPEFAVTNGAGKVYVNIEDKAEMLVIDAQTLALEKRYSLAPCQSPSGLAIDPKGRLYSVCDNQLMVVSDPAAGKVIGQAPIGKGPDGVALLEGKAYSANGLDGTVSVVTELEPGRWDRTATYETAFGARTIAADPQTRQLFLPTAEFRPASASAPAATRRETVGGSFRLLVLRLPDASATAPGAAASPAKP